MSTLGPGHHEVVSIQVLRGLAAMLVVFHHAVAARAGFFSPMEGTDFGTVGIAVFFVISGFIMTHVCRNESLWIFAVRRIIRVVPLYWIMTLVYCAILVRADFSRGTYPDHMRDLLLSLLFIPHFHDSIPDRIWPILVPGWTLNFEMFFFLLFGLSIATKRPVTTSVATILILVGTGALLDAQSAILRTWTDPLLVLFAAGITLAVLHARWPLWRARPLAWLTSAILATFALGLLDEPLAIPLLFFSAAFLVAGVLSFEPTLPMKAGLLRRLGDASYSIYLSHTILMIPIFKGLRHLPLAGWAQFAVVLPLVLGLCAAGGLLIHNVVEKPLLRLLRRILTPDARLGPGDPAVGPA